MKYLKVEKTSFLLGIRLYILIRTKPERTLRTPFLNFLYKKGVLTFKKINK